MAMPASLYYTAPTVRGLNAREQRNWPRYETVHGELLVSPAPRMWHQEIIGRLLLALRQYLDQEKVGHVLASPADISWGEDTLVQPDVFVIPVDEARTLQWRHVRTLLLVIEVLSPGTERADRFAKRRLYQEQGVPMYWVVDADAGTAEVWTPEQPFPRFEREPLEWQPAGATQPFVLSLAELCRPI